MRPAELAAVEDAVLELRLLARSFDDLASLADDPDKQPAWCFVLARAVDRLDGTFEALCQALVAERGQGSACPVLSLVDARQPVADGPGLDAS